MLKLQAFINIFILFVLVAYFMVYLCDSAHYVAVLAKTDGFLTYLHCAQPARVSFK